MVFLAAILAGCVERQITVTSEPAGALVYISDVEVGRTPVTIPFTWYGDYDVQLRADGYETLVTHANITPPWYEVPPIDLFSEIFPIQYKDHRYLNYKLAKYVTPTNQELIDRAKKMAEKTNEPVEK
jgi:hypothetical protein